MAQPQSKTFVLHAGRTDDPATERGVVTFTAARIVKRQQYMDLRDERGETVATLTWKSTIGVREL